MLLLPGGLSRHHRCQLRLRPKLCRMCWCTASQLLRRRLRQPSVQPLSLVKCQFAASAEVDAYAVQANGPSCATVKCVVVCKVVAFTSVHRDRTNSDVQPMSVATEADAASVNF